MKKFIFMLLTVLCTVAMKAQTAIETSKFTDNVSLGIEGGVSTPLALDNLFPLNASAGLRLTKMFSPVWGAEVEGTAWFGSHMYGNTRFDGSIHNIVRGSYVGLNGVINWSNLLLGYNGVPRTFEVSTVTGIGWLHQNTPNVNDEYSNYLGAKTGLDLAFNLGNSKAHTISVRPAVLWNLSQPGNSRSQLAFNKLGAQLYLGVGYTYHFKNSNGTHYFKTYNIADYEGKIAYLTDALAQKPKEVIVEKVIIKEVPITSKTIAPATSTYVFFAQGSAELTAEAKAELDKVEGTVNVTATASPEGSASFNRTLSQRRADAVKEYLIGRGVTVVSATGLGVQGNTSNRASKVTTE